MSFSVAHHFAPATATLLTQHPAIGDVRAIDTADRWGLPTDVDVIFALHGSDDESHADAPRPAGWPGQVKLVQIASSGIDGYPEWLFEAPQVATAAGTSAGPIAEYVLTVILMHEKRLPAMQVRDGDAWVAQDAMVQNPLGSLDGKTVGLIGMGEIGARVAKLAQAFGARVVASRRSGGAGPEGVEIVPLEAVLARADHLVIAAPLSPETAGLLDAVAFAKCRRGVHLVNIARGGIVDTGALIEALMSGQVGAASLDVTDPEPLPTGHPLWSAPNVRITPHVAWSSAGTPGRIFKLFAENVGRLATGEPVRNLVGK
ncbi:NAD(P)-dependent oxidoreductase [Glacieibacterium frigidum]|uniref:Dihydrofolate reductase n=1 Tax=Glacieibacterium frigidum TaxID=2593303 RepID=A0A552U8J1_9SPHN|nr:NAD(P)-dependent oxidoreductase [Glacieibacterium frigidum]TRW14537.1 dihydrofolate reductase [Glacieibacterium frigidum]